MTKYYYDTGMFGYFLFRKDWDHQYSPTKVSGYISVLCEQELINSCMNGHFKNWAEDWNFIDISESMMNVSALFQPSDVKLSDVRAKFIHMMGTLTQNNIDLYEDVKKHNKDKDSMPKPPDGMDWMHIAIADLFKCDTVLTTDKDFKYLSKVGKFLKLESVKKIIVLSPDNKSNNVEEIILY